ncbi:bifunctional 2-C-methyl-D-erythritol 4-phosphate cytidylyltransferase/2-C-methyl-D-erythritol 2,4-cyclodiphosphate synthase [Polymorphobacter arshaanensis]|uniref:Bifunctional enzyme IspD/IspF n=1 Tax=Glacieibacterium arshaanense TaxID=2511025 RepID=A0A4Y9ERP0_9SPHN|nr:bifunctional 2-C-methyl-D-erythritol 4-phosphate cytidylyltransferase/2-C-methyl-D-erythritol 2,4-cyclodiphosphate synthase [Polymorphobacter arshaanensis]TFU06306.1 bifunctional 2-C-methyl-D-erythritol 4-phosphate cytidylyltransferase/2-C-methyl-D-erythritol 2,4-cyclodiphosphate synthase [Polymorphobacter arshaanensis]
MHAPVQVLIVAAGRGFRAGAGGPKQYRLLGGQTVLRHAVEALLNHPRIDAVRVVIHPDDAEAYAAAIAGLDIPPPVHGGATRQASVRAGLEAVAADGGAKIVLIHDAARPFVPQAMVDRILAALATQPGATPALAVVDSLRRGADGLVEASIDRAGLWRVQTPQGFAFDAILAAHRNAAPDATDDVEVARTAGLDVAIVDGDERAFKLTVAEDFRRAEAVLAASTLPATDAAPTYISRTASGFDVHRFGPGDHLWLGGIKIAYSQGLVGHSDADVALHALTDALLGTVGAGDIGSHFPPSDPQWKGAASDRFLSHARDLVRDAGGIIDHVDLTIMAEAPKVGPHRETIRARIAALLDIAVANVSVKATTTEGLGFTGRREGIAAQALASVRLAPQAT